MGQGGTSISQSDGEHEETDTTVVVDGKGLLDWKPARWALIYGLPAVTFFLAGSAIFVARMSVGQDIHLLAQESWTTGGRAAARIVAYDRSGRLVDEVAAELSLSGEGRDSVVVAEAGIGGAPALDLDIEVPDWPPGSYRLRANVVTSAGREQVDAELRLVARAAGGSSPAELFRPSPPPDRMGPGRTKATIGDVTVELLPRGAGLVPELSNILFVRTTDAHGRPLSTEIDFEVVGGTMEITERRRTDRLGLAVMSVVPRSPDVVVRPSIPGAEGAPHDVDAGLGDGGVDPDGSPLGRSSRIDAADPEVVHAAQIVIPTTPAQVVMRIDQPLPEAASPLDVSLLSLHSSRPIYVDAFTTTSGRWIAAKTGRFQSNRARLRLPRLPAGLLLVQATTTTVEVGYGYAAHHLYLRESGQDDETVLLAIAEELRRRDIDRLWVDTLLEQGLFRDVSRVELAAAFMLSRLDQGFRRPTLRVNSEQVRSRELSNFQRSFRRSISLSIVIIGVLVTLLLAYAFSIAAWKGRRQRQLFDAEVGGDEDDLYVTDMGRPKGLDRFRVIMQIALMIGVIAAGFFFIAILISIMSWQG